MTVQGGKYEILPERSSATINGWSEQLAFLLVDARIRSLRIRGWHEAGFDALAALHRDLVELFVECDVSDLGALASLTQLEALHVRDGIETVDFSRLRRLEYLSIWSPVPRFGSIASCASLRTLKITDGGLRDLSPLSGLVKLRELVVSEAPLQSLNGTEEFPALERLVLQQVPLQSLQGIERLDRLAELSVFMASRLESINELRHLAHLRSLELGSCPRIHDLEAIGSFSQLSNLELVQQKLPSSDFLGRLTQLHRLKLENASKVTSLSFLRSFNALEELLLLGNTTIEDGDLTVLLNLPRLEEVVFKVRRHYSHTLESLMRVLVGRHTWGPGSFENRASERWCVRLASWKSWNRLSMVAAYTNAIQGFKNSVLPAKAAQEAIAAAEVLALLANRGDASGPEIPDTVLEWIAAHPSEPTAEHVATAVESLERVVTPPSSLLDIWIERRQQAAWLRAIAGLKARLQIGIAFGGTAAPRGAA